VLAKFEIYAEADGKFYCWNDNDQCYVEITQRVVSPDKCPPEAVLKITKALANRRKADVERT